MLALPWLALLAHRRGLRYEPDADERWMRVWEPFVTLRTPVGYAHSLHATGAMGSLTLARTTVERRAFAAGEWREVPVEAWIVIAQDPHIEGHAAVTNDFTSPFTEDPALVALPRTPTGDPLFDREFATFSRDPATLPTTLTPSLRRLLASWRIPVHLELRPGGFVLAPTSLGFDDRSASWLIDAAHLVGEKAAKQG